MKTLIVGTNGEGCFVGSQLIKVGAAVSFLTSSQRAEEIRRHGMIVRNPGGHFQCPVHAITPDGISSNYDVVIFASRAHKFTFARAAALAAIRPSTIVLSFNFDPIALSIMADDGVGLLAGGVPNFAASLLGDGSVRQSGAPPTLVVGGLTAEASSIASARQLFADTDISLAVSEHIREDMWAHFVGRAAQAVASTWQDRWRRRATETQVREIVRKGFEIGAARDLKLSSSHYEFATNLHRPLFERSLNDEALHNLKVLVRLGQDEGLDVDSLCRTYEDLLKALSNASSAQQP